MTMTIGVLACALGAVRAAGAQPANDSTAFPRGDALYAEHCAVCHQEDGGGRPPTFPALRGNDRLADTARIVSVVRDGAGNMSPFPELTVDDIAAVARYVRNAWGNAYGDVRPPLVAGLLDESDAGETMTVWDGVYTAAQAARGQAIYRGACGACHGRRLNGAPEDPDMRSTPPLARARFLRTWSGRSLATLFDYTRATMPEDNPASLTGAEYVDVIAYMLEVGGMPAGDAELPPDAARLARVVVRPRR